MSLRKKYRLVKFDPAYAHFDIVEDDECLNCIYLKFNFVVLSDKAELDCTYVLQRLNVNEDYEDVLKFQKIMSLK